MNGENIHKAYWRDTEYCSEHYTNARRTIIYGIKYRHHLSVPSLAKWIPVASEEMDEIDARIFAEEGTQRYSAILKLNCL